MTFDSGLLFNYSLCWCERICCLLVFSIKYLRGTEYLQNRKLNNSFQSKIVRVRRVKVVNEISFHSIAE